jgi:hypothetical protein
MNLLGESRTNDYAGRACLALKSRGYIMSAPYRSIHTISFSLSLSGLRSPSSGGRPAAKIRKPPLATADAATLGMMVFYNWREKKLAKDDPEGYARLQRLKALFRTGELDAAPEKKARRTTSHPLHYQDNRHKNTGFGASH